MREDQHPEDEQAQTGRNVAPPIEPFHPVEELLHGFGLSRTHTSLLLTVHRTARPRVPKYTGTLILWRRI